VQTDLGRSELVYQVIGDQPHNHHLVCLSRGTFINVDDSVLASLRDQLSREFGFEPRINHIAV